MVLRKSYAPEVLRLQFTTVTKLRRSMPCIVNAVSERRHHVDAGGTIADGFTGDICKLCHILL